MTEMDDALRSLAYVQRMVQNREERRKKKEEKGTLRERETRRICVTAGKEGKYTVELKPGRAP